MTNTRDALSKLIHLNPSLEYTVTEDMRYFRGQLTKQTKECSFYYIHVHYGHDGAGMRQSNVFTHDNLDVALEQAKAFVTKIST